MQPKNLKEAKAYGYREWAGKPDGSAYYPGYCAYEVSDEILFHQCNRKPGYGTDKIFCKQHSKMMESDNET